MRLRYPCGTEPGYQRHIRRQEDPCTLCRAAANAGRRFRYQNRRSLGAAKQQAMIRDVIRVLADALGTYPDCKQETNAMPEDFTRPIGYLRVTPELHAWVTGMATQAGISNTEVIRALLVHAKRAGWQVRRQDPHKVVTPE